MKTEIAFFIQTVTPADAKKWLANNDGNRHISEQTVKGYVMAMRRGEWILTGDPIKFSPEGRLLDGQHRLQAVIEYDKPVQFHIAENVPDEAFTVIDTGKNRTAGDVVSTKGYKYATVLAAAAKGILLFAKGYYDISGGTRRFGITNTQIFEWIEKHPDVHEIAKYTQSVAHSFRYISHADLTMLYCMLYKKNQVKCEEFFEKYRTGIDLKEKDPVRILREKLIRDSGLLRGKFSKRDKLALFIRAWNYTVTGNTVSNFSLEKNYKFPKPL